MPATAGRAPRVKITLRLPEDVIATANQAVAVGLSPSVTSFIEEAIRARAREVRNAGLYALAAEAMADPDFVADLRDTMAAFECAQCDSWPLQPREMVEATR